MLTAAYQRLVSAAKARLLFAFRDAFFSGLAAVIAWELSRALWGHERPTFAAVAVIVCLAPGLPSHLKQTWRMLLGCTIGIVIAEVAWMMPEHHPMLRLGGSVFIALLMGCLLSPTPIAAIQAAVSVLLVWAMGPAVAGEARLIDVCTGAAVGLVFSQILFTQDPVKTIAVAAQKLIGQVGKGLAAMAVAFEAKDDKQAEKALSSITQAYVNLSDLQAAVELGNQDVKWSLRGRWQSQQVLGQVSRYGRHAARVYGSALLLGEGLARNLAHDDGPPPVALQQKLDALVQLLNRMDVSQVNVDASLFQALKPLSQRMQFVEGAASSPQATSAENEPMSSIPLENIPAERMSSLDRWIWVDEYATQVALALLELLDSEQARSTLNKP